VRAPLVFFGPTISVCLKARNAILRERGRSALLLEVFDRRLPRSGRGGGLRRSGLGTASLRTSKREIAGFHTLRGTTRPDHARHVCTCGRLALLGRPTAVARDPRLGVRRFGLIGPWGGCLPRAQHGWPPLLNRPRINRGSPGPAPEHPPPLWRPRRSPPARFEPSSARRSSVTVDPMSDPLL
jgi:hypothetical protein